MTIRVTILKPNVFDQYGLPMNVGQTYTVDNDFARSLIYAQKASDPDAATTALANPVQPAIGKGTPVNLIYVNAGNLSSPVAQTLRHVDEIYALNTAPYTRYRSNGTAMIQDAVGSPALITDNTAVSAAANLTNLQAMLTAGGIVNIPGGLGTVYFNGTAQIPDDTTLNVGPGTTLTQYASTNLLMLCNTAFKANAINITLSWSSGLVVTATWPSAHGLTVGKYVSIFNVSPSMFCGVFRVKTVPTTLTLTFEVYRVPTGSPIAFDSALSTDNSPAYSGSIQGKIANRNIHVYIDGLIDWNYSAQGTPSLGSNKTTVLLGHIADSDARIRVANCLQRAVCLGAAYNCQVRVTAPDTQSEIFKIYGPAFGCTTYATGQGSDDGASLQTREPTAYILYRWTVGDILHHTHGVDILNKNGTANTGTVVLYGSKNELMDDITVNGIHGTNTSGFAFKMLGNPDDAGITGGQFGLVRIFDNDCAAKWAYGFKADFTAREILADGWAFNPVDITNPPIVSDPACSIRRLTFANVKLDDTTFPTGAAGLFDTYGIIDEVTWKDCYLRGSATLRIMQLTDTAGSFRRIALERVTQATGDTCIRVLTSITGSPVISIHDSDIACSAILNASASCILKLSGGNRFNNPSLGVLRTGGTITCSIFSDGTNTITTGPTTNWVIVPSGTPVLTLYGYDIQVDPLALTGLQTTAGQYFYSVRAGAINQGPTVRSAAGWVALATGAAGVNTVIT